jgi:hypothetical protein
MKQIAVLFAEDHVIAREGFRKILELEDDLEVLVKRKMDIRLSPSP